MYNNTTYKRVWSAFSVFLAISLVLPVQLFTIPVIVAIAQDAADPAIDFTQTASPRCGNEILEQEEQCDDANTSDGDGCSSLCQIEIPPTPICGNQILEGGEQCDDGNVSNNDGCSLLCETEGLPSITICKWDDTSGDGASDDQQSIDTPILGWGVGLLDRDNPTIIDTELVMLNLVGINPISTTDSGCYTFPDLQPGHYRAVELRRDGWTPTAAIPNGTHTIGQDILTGLTIPPQPPAIDSFFDVFVDVDLDFGDEKTVNFYNYKSKYCGDGIVNQSWEQCDGGEGCTKQCQFVDDNMCKDLVLARINTTDVQNIPSDVGDMTDNVFLGSAINQIPNGTWFALFENASSTAFIDPDIAGYEDVEGLAVERQAGNKVRVVMHGSNGAGNIEHADGVLEFWNASIEDLLSDDANGAGVTNKLENGFDGLHALMAGQDEVATTSPNSASYWLTTTGADDGFLAEWKISQDCIGICGIKFEDINKNETQDENEQGVESWLIILSQIIPCEDDDQDCDSPTYEPVSETTTNFEGKFCFPGIEEGSYQVTEESRNGWKNTTPDSVEVPFNGEEIAYVSFGNIRLGSISGMKFFDFNHNGVKDMGDIGLPGWVILLSWDGDGSPVPTITENDGSYVFENLEDGEYTVSEEDQEENGWFQIYPVLNGGEWSVELGLGEHRTGVNFGNDSEEDGSIHGLKYEDENGDGNRDEGEDGLSGWTIELYPVTNGATSTTPTMATTTMSGGMYWFESVIPGLYEIREVQKDGWTQTEPAEPNSCALVDFTHDGIIGIPDFGVLIGVQNKITACLGKTSANIPDWTNLLCADADLNNDNAVGASDQSEFDDLFALFQSCFGNVVGEPNHTYTLFVLPGQSYEGYDFGNHFTGVLGSIHGLKYNDENNNGDKDGEEGGLEEWEIELYLILEGGEKVLVDIELTEEDGSYWFMDLEQGTYEVKEVQQDGWTQTEPAGECALVDFDDDGIVGLADFGLLKMIYTKIDDTCFGRSSADEDWGILGCDEGDLDGDGTVGIEDFGKFKQLYQTFLSCFLKYVGESGTSYIVEVDGGEYGSYDFGNHRDLEIFEEENGQGDDGGEEANDASFTVTWKTNHSATSRVVYGTTSVNPVGTAPNYGYPLSTVEDPTLVTSHSVTLTGLTEGATYYWRAVSSASPEVVGDTEQTFKAPDQEAPTPPTSPKFSAPAGGGGGGGGVFCYDGSGLNCSSGGTEVGGTQTSNLGSFTGGGASDGSGEFIAQGDGGTGAGGGDGSGTGTSGGTETETGGGITPEEETDLNNQLASVGFLGLDYECNMWTSILALIVLLIIAIYAYAKHDKTWQAIIGAIIGGVIFFALGAYNCTWLLALLAALIIILIGWDLKQKKE